MTELQIKRRRHQVCLFSIRPKTTALLRHPEQGHGSAPISRRPDDTLHPAEEWHRGLRGSTTVSPSALFSTVHATRGAPNGKRTAAALNVTLEPRRTEPLSVLKT